MGGGDESVWEAQLLHSGLSTLRHGGVDKVQGDQRVFSAVARCPVSDSG